MLDRKLGRGQALRARRDVWLSEWAGLTLGWGREKEWGVVICLGKGQDLFRKRRAGPDAGIERGRGLY